MIKFSDNIMKKLAQYPADSRPYEQQYDEMRQARFKELLEIRTNYERNYVSKPKEKTKDRTFVEKGYKTWMHD